MRIPEHEDHDERRQEQCQHRSEHRDERPQQDRADLPHFLLQLGREQLQPRVRDRDQRAGEVAERLEQPGDADLRSVPAEALPSASVAIAMLAARQQQPDAAGRRRPRCRPTATDSRARTRRSRRRPRARGAALRPRSQLSRCFAWRSDSSARARTSWIFSPVWRRRRLQQRLGIAHDGLEVGHQLVGGNFGVRGVRAHVAGPLELVRIFRLCAVRVNLRAIPVLALQARSCLHGPWPRSRRR